MLHTPSLSQMIFHSLSLWHMFFLCEPSFTHSFCLLRSISQHHCHTIFPYHFSHIQTQFVTRDLFTHHFTTHLLSHTTLTPTISYAQLHNFLSHTIFEKYSEAAVALVNLHLHFAWLLWHLVTSIVDLVSSIFVSHDRRGNRWHPRSVFCVAAAALMASGWLRWHTWAGLVAVMPLNIVWQPLYLLGNIFHFGLRGRRGIWGFAGTWRPLSWFCVTGDSFCVAPVALMARVISGGVLGHDWSPIWLVNIVWPAWHLVNLPWF